MVKIRVTGETTFDWLEAKVKNGPSGNCKVQATFNEECFEGTPVTQKEYDVTLSATIKGSTLLNST